MAKTNGNGKLRADGEKDNRTENPGRTPLPWAVELITPWGKREVTKTIALMESRDAANTVATYERAHPLRDYDGGVVKVEKRA